jgi:hypothetical protein
MSGRLGRRRQLERLVLDQVRTVSLGFAFGF